METRRRAPKKRKMEEDRDEELRQTQSIQNLIQNSDEIGPRDIMIFQDDQYSVNPEDEVIKQEIKTESESKEGAVEGKLMFEHNPVKFEIEEQKIVVLNEEATISNDNNETGGTLDYAEEQGPSEEQQIKSGYACPNRQSPGVTIGSLLAKSLSDDEQGCVESMKRNCEDSSNNRTSKAECPSCHKIPRAKIFQCVNGHSMCESCSEKVEICPNCQSPGVKIRNLLAESLLDGQEFKCKWRQQGCEKTMKRNRLSAHEDDCDHNPDWIKFCSKFPQGRKCPYKFTSKWLSDPENCIEFEKHVKSCLSVIHSKDPRYGKQLRLLISFKDILPKLKQFNQNRLVYYSFPPIFLRLPAPSSEGKVELLCLFVVWKVDSSGNRFVSFAFVQLTPETAKIVVELKTEGYPSSLSNTVTESGQVKLSPLKWTMKPMDFNNFLKMVENPSNIREPEMPVPFSVPVSFLLDHYSSEDKRKFCVGCTVKLIS